MGYPGKWKHGLKHVVLWWFNFDPYHMSAGAPSNDHGSLFPYQPFGGFPQWSSDQPLCVNVASLVVWRVAALWCGFGYGIVSH